MALHYRTRSPGSPPLKPNPAHALHMNDGHHLIIVYDSNTSHPRTPELQRVCVFCLPLFVCLCAALDMSSGLFVLELNAE